jgi:hypothetical protein
VLNSILKAGLIIIPPAFLIFNSFESWDVIVVAQENQTDVKAMADAVQADATG